MAIIGSKILCFMFHIAVITATFDVQSFGFKTAAGVADGTAHTIELTLWFNHTIYLCLISNPYRNTTYSCSSSRYSILNRFRCNTPKYKLLIVNPSLNDSVTLENVFVTTKAGITYGINSICIPNAGNQNLGGRYADFLVTNSTDCSAGFQQYNKICVNDQMSACYPRHQLLFFDISEPNKYITNALWNGTFAWNVHLITCSPTISPITFANLTVSPTNIPSKNATFIPTATPTIVPSPSPSNFPSAAAAATSLPPTFLPTAAPIFRSTELALYTTLSDASNVVISTEMMGDNARNSVDHFVTNILIMSGVLIVLFVIFFCVYLIYRCKQINDKIDELNFDNHYVQMDDDQHFYANENEVFLGVGANVNVAAYEQCDSDVVAAVNETDMGVNEEFVIGGDDGMITKGEEMYGMENGIAMDEDVREGVECETIVSYDRTNNDNENILLDDNFETIQ